MMVGSVNVMSQRETITWGRYSVHLLKYTAKRKETGLPQDREPENLEPLNQPQPEPSSASAWPPHAARTQPPFYRICVEGQDG